MPCDIYLLLDKLIESEINMSSREEINFLMRLKHKSVYHVL